MKTNKSIRPDKFVLLKYQAFKNSVSLLFYLRNVGFLVLFSLFLSRTTTAVNDYEYKKI